MAGYNPAAPYGQGPGQGQAPPGPSYHNQNPTPQYGDQQNTNMNYTNQTAYGSNNTNTTGTFPPAMTFPPPPPPFNNATAGATGGVPPLPFPDWMEGIQNGQLLQLPLFNGAWFPPFPLPPPPPSMAGLNNSFAFGNNAGVGTTFDPANFPLPPPFPGQMNTGNAATMLPPPPHSQLSRQSSTQNMSAATGTVIPGLALHGQPSSASTGTLPPPSPFRRSKVPSDDVEMSEGEYVSRDNSPSTYAQGAPGMGSQPARGTLGLPKDMRILQNAKDMKNGKGRSSKQRSPRLPPPSDDFGDVSAARTNFSAFPALSRRASEKYNTRETRRPSIDSYRPIYDSAHDIRPELFPNGAGSRRSSFDLNLNPSGRRSSDLYEDSNSNKMGNSLSRRSTPPDEGRLNYDDKPIHAPAVSGPKKTTSITFPPTPVDAVPAILAEARRKAQNAVLNLLPHGVGFDDFILEGIDEQVVTSVFEAVGASIKKKQATQPAKSAKPAPAATSLPKDVPTGPKSMKWASKADSAINATIPKPGEVTVSPAVPSFGSAPLVVPRRASSSSLAKPATTAVTEKQPVTPIESRKGGATSDAAAKKGEERKDRIARLLEAKNKKAEKPSPPAKSAPAVKPVETVQSSVPKEATKSDASKEAPPVPEVAEPAPPEPTAMELDTAKPDETPQSVLTPVEAPAEVTKVDKSELLKQKMKALLKERQEKAAADAASAKTNEMSSFQRSRSESPAYNFSYSPNAPQYQASFNSAGAPPIPGLFLSQSNFPQFQPPFEQFAPYQFTQDATQQDIMQQEAVQPLPPPPPAQNPEIVNTRKRRVASDFNDFAPPEAPPAYKRPFGYSQPSPVFLEVSDDEDEADDEDDAMDVDDENDMMDVDESSINPFSAPSNLRGTTKSLRDSQPLSDTKKPYKPASGVGTPSVIPGFGRPSARAEDLKAKELQIEEMRRKIAEAEQRSKLKQSTGESQQPTPTIDRSATSSIDKSSQIDRHLSKVNQNIASSSQRLDRAQEVTYVVSALPLAPGAVPFVHRPPTPNAEHIALREDVRKLRGKMTAAMADLRQKGKAKNELKSELIELNAAADAELAKQGITLRALNDANARAGRGGRDADSESAGEDRRASTALENEQQASIVEVEDASGPPQSFSISEEDTPMVESSASIRDTTSAEPTNDIKFDITSPDNEDASMEGTDSDFSAATDIGRDSSAAASNAVAEVSESESSSSDNSSEEGEVAESDVEMAGDVTGNADAANEDEDSDEAMDESDDSDSSEQPTSTTQGIPLTSQAASMSPDIPVAPPSPLAAPPAASAAVEPSFAPVSSSTLNAPSTTQQHSPNPPSTNQYKAKYFTPYQSPLRQFHAYRFHPNFNKEVPGGYKSLTYAHNIRPNDELCRFETAGGVCNDRTCMMQHFREIAMTDSSILGDLGSPNEMGPDEKMRFITGMKSVLSELRQRNVREFEKIADAIVGFRREFGGGRWMD